MFLKLKVIKKEDFLSVNFTVGCKKLQNNGYLSNKMSVIIEQAGNHRTRCPIIPEILVQLQPILLSLYKLMSYCNNSNKVFFYLQFKKKVSEERNVSSLVWSIHTYLLYTNRNFSVFHTLSSFNMMQTRHLKLFSGGNQITW